MAIKYPATYDTCGAAVKSKTARTHHNRLCLEKLAAKIAFLVSTPSGFTIRSASKCFTITRDDAGKYAVAEWYRGRGFAKNLDYKTCDLFDDPIEAARKFLERSREHLDVLGGRR